MPKKRASGRKRRVKTQTAKAKSTRTTSVRIAPLGFAYDKTVAEERIGLPTIPSSLPKSRSLWKPLKEMVAVLGKKVIVWFGGDLS